MGCKLSISVVHPENVIKRFSPKKNILPPKKIVQNILNSPDSTDSYKTLYIDDSPEL